MFPSLSHIPFAAFHLHPKIWRDVNPRLEPAIPSPPIPRAFLVHRKAAKAPKNPLPEPFTLPPPPPPSKTPSQRPPLRCCSTRHKKGDLGFLQLVPSWVSTAPAVNPCLGGMGKDGGGIHWLGGFGNHVGRSRESMRNHQPGCSAREQTHGENLGMHRRTGMSLDTAAPRELGPRHGEGFWGIQLLLCRGRRNLSPPGR